MRYLFGGYNHALPDKLGTGWNWQKSKIEPEELLHDPDADILKPATIPTLNVLAGLRPQLRSDRLECAVMSGSRS